MERNEEREKDGGRGNSHERENYGERHQKIIFRKNSCDICVNSPHYPLKTIHNQDLCNTSGLLWPECCFIE